MARPLRIQYPGAVYHITARGNARQAIFKDDGDRNVFLETLASTVQRYNWLCHSYCLMDNHYHLLIETVDATLSQGMRQLNGNYTQSFNRKHSRVGHVFQGRFKSILVEKESHLLELCRYIVLNPVAAGIVQDPSQYPWTSYGFTAHQVKKPEFLYLDWVLCQFSNDDQKARRLYRDFVFEGMQNTQYAPWKQLVGQFILGSDHFVSNVELLIDERKGEKEIPKLQRYAGRPILQDLLTGSNCEDKQVRNSLICKAHLEYGYTLKEIADHLSIHYTTVSRIVNRAV